MPRNTNIIRRYALPRTMRRRSAATRRLSRHTLRCQQTKPLVFCGFDKRKQKHRMTSVIRCSMLALPIFPCSHPQSIVGANELNCRVRNGNGWILIAINTNYSVTGFNNCLADRLHESSLRLLLCVLMHTLSQPLLCSLLRLFTRIVSASTSVTVAAPASAFVATSASAASAIVSAVNSLVW